MREVLLASSVLIVALTALRAALRDRVPARFTYALWLLAALRLMLPFSLAPSPVSVMNAAPAPRAEQTEPAPDYETGGVVHIDNDSFAGESAPITPGETEAGPEDVPSSPAAVPEQQAKRDYSGALKAIWLLGSALTAAYFLAVNGALWFALRGERRPLELDGGGLRVYHARRLSSPCLFGLLRPAIYLTDAALETDERTQFALLHERTHYRHGDHIWGLLRCVLLCAYWFDPFVWLAAALSKRDAELACDESCMAAMSCEKRLEYGRALVDLLDRGQKRSGILSAATTMSGGKRAVRERVRRIASVPRTKKAVLGLAVALLCVLAACTFTGAQHKREVTDPEAYLTNVTGYTRLGRDDVQNSGNEDFLWGFSFWNAQGKVTDTYIEPVEYWRTHLHYGDINQNTYIDLETSDRPGVFMSDTLAAVSWTDPEGWLCVCVSRDRGENWAEPSRLKHVGPDGYSLVGFLTAERGWVCHIDLTGATRYWLTADGGETWHETPPMVLQAYCATGALVTPGGGLCISTADGYYIATGFGVLSRVELAPEVEQGGTYTALCPIWDGGKIVLTFLVNEDGTRFERFTIDGFSGDFIAPEPDENAADAVELVDGVYIRPLESEEDLSRFWSVSEYGGDEGTPVVVYADAGEYLMAELCEVSRPNGETAELGETLYESDWYSSESIVFRLEPGVELGLRACTFNSRQGAWCVGLNEDGTLKLEEVYAGVRELPEDGAYSATGHGVFARAAGSGGDVAADFDFSEGLENTMAVSLTATKRATGLRFFKLDYRLGYIEPFEGETVATEDSLAAGGEITLILPVDVNRARFGFAFADEAGEYHAYYFNVPAAISSSGSGLLAALPYNHAGRESLPAADTGFGIYVSEAYESLLWQFEGWDICRSYPQTAENVRYVAICAETPGINFEVFAGSPGQGRAIYEADFLTPERPLVLGVKTSESGPTRGFAFTDGQGARHAYLIDFGDMDAGKPIELIPVNV